MMDRNRHVVFHVVDTLDGGGTERVLLSLLHRMQNKTFDHVLVTLRNAGQLTEFLPEHVGCHALDTKGRSFRAGMRLARVAHAYKATIVHARNTCCWADALMVRLLRPRTRIVLGFHGLESGAHFSTRHRVMATVGRLIGARFAVVACSGRKKLIRECNIAESCIDILPNGVDAERYSPVDAGTKKLLRRKMRLSESDFVVGTVGSLTAVKDQATLIRAVGLAAAAINQLRLVIVGDGDQRRSLVQAAREAGIEQQVLFTGSCKDIPSILRCFDIYASPSLSEGMSNAVLEAMATALPILATNVGGNKELVREGIEGRLVPAASIQTMANGLIEMAGSSHERTTQGQNARRRATTFSLESMAIRYDAMYQRLATGSSDNPRSADRPMGRQPASVTEVR